MSRVEAPHEVCQTYSSDALGVGVGDVEGRAKFWPSSWLVPICRALPSPIIPSQVQVRVAPAKRSRAVLWPVSTGMRATSTMVAR
jgi:hypothetical protein